MRKWCRQATASPAAAPAARATTPPKPIPYNLYTHCGIGYYETTPPLNDGSGNPPPGWGNPYQPRPPSAPDPAPSLAVDGPSTAYGRALHHDHEALWLPWQPRVFVIMNPAGAARAYGATRASVRGLMAARLAARLSGRPYRAPMAAGAV